MNYFNIIAGMASIISLLITVCVYKEVNQIKINLKIENNSTKKINKISQKAIGENISQIGRDKND
jgi:hypothetical protein